MVKVAVGTTCLGNGTIRKPPINSTYNRPFDCTVDNLNNTFIFVKYNINEHYPEYLITLKK